MTSELTATVVVPTEGRIALTRSCLESIRRASIADNMPVDICVVDSSSSGEREQLQEICEQVGARFLQGPKSVSEKRNMGAADARTSCVMFLDSDCVMTTGCVAAHLSTLADATIEASQGKVLFQGPERLAFRAVRSSGLLNAFLPEHGACVQTAAAGNLMVRRLSFLSIRFDPLLGPPGLGGEDVDFGLRLVKQGYRFVGTPAAVVYHDTLTWNSFVANLGRFVAWGRAEAHLIERHPENCYLDLPSPALVALAVSVTSAVAWLLSPVALLAFPLGFVTYGTAMALVGMRKHPADPAGGAIGHWVFFVLDAGRILESVLLARPATAARRLRFTEDQVAQEWGDLVPMSWATWLTTLAVIVFLWWSVQ